jgi:hypothetical protein
MPEHAALLAVAAAARAYREAEREMAVTSTFNDRWEEVDGACRSTRADLDAALAAFDAAGGGSNG